MDQHNQPSQPYLQPGSFKDWDVDAALDVALSNKNLLNIPYAEQTRQILDQSGPVAARQIAHIAMYAQSDSVRLRAATYLVDKQLEFSNSQSMLDPLEDLLADVVQAAEGFTKQPNTGA